MEWGFCFLFSYAEFHLFEKKDEIILRKGGGGWLQEMTRMDVDVSRQDDKGR